jgi:hypothetical protein
VNVQYTQKQKGIDLTSQLERHDLDPAHAFLTHLHARPYGGTSFAVAAELTTWAMEEGVLVSTVDGGRGRRNVQRSAEMIRTFHEMYPEVQVWFSHDELHLE